MKFQYFLVTLFTCLLTYPVFSAQEMGCSRKMMVCPMMNTNPMTESDLLTQMDDTDKATYQSMNAAGKALILKMANMTKIQNNPIMVMQHCMGMMENCMGMMDAMTCKMQAMQSQNQGTQKK